ncbi:MAG TPA: class I SAM-dependent DNA methyltransferase, partial [Salinarimonas sp.]|nr:class I SAM-dependent DNA methyltransferase [Salinarimonas sp.]
LSRLYSAISKLRSGATLTRKEQDIAERGLAHTLVEIHDTIDRLTAQAYGWPADLPDQAILERLVALNAERAREEAEGQVRWLRPDWQAPRARRAEAARAAELDLDDIVVAIDRGKPAFPRDRHEQPLAVERALAGAERSMDAAALARTFRGGGARLEPAIARALATLARYGRIVALPDGRFAARRAA